jgi:hypothetical protein
MRSGTCGWEVGAEMRCGTCGLHEYNFMVCERWDCPNLITRRMIESDENKEDYAETEAAEDEGRKEGEG